DLRVLDACRLIKALALHPLGDERGRRDRRSATVGLELGIFDAPIRTHLDLQLHHVAAGRRADHARADVVRILPERTDIARVFVVIQNLVAVSHDATPFLLYAFSALPIPPY